MHFRNIKSVRKKKTLKYKSDLCQNKFNLNLKLKQIVFYLVYICLA